MYFLASEIIFHMTAVSATITFGSFSSRSNSVSQIESRNMIGLLSDSVSKLPWMTPSRLNAERTLGFSLANCAATAPPNDCPTEETQLVSRWVSSQWPDVRFNSDN